MFPLVKIKRRNDEDEEISFPSFTPNLDSWLPKISDTQHYNTSQPQFHSDQIRCSFCQKDFEFTPNTRASSSSSSASFKQKMNYISACDSCLQKDSARQKNSSSSSICSSTTIRVATPDVILCNFNSFNPDDDEDDDDLVLERLDPEESQDHQTGGSSVFENLFKMAYDIIKHWYTPGTNDFEVIWQVRDFYFGVNVKSSNDKRKYYEAYIESSQISNYLCILQQLIETTTNNNNNSSNDVLVEKERIKSRLDIFNQSLILQNPDVISIFCPQLAKTVKQQSVQKPVSSVLFVHVIDTSLTYFDKNQIEIPISSCEVKRIVQSLYPGFRLLELFEFVETCRWKISQKLIKKLDRCCSIRPTPSSSSSVRATSSELTKTDFVLLEKLIDFCLNDDTIGNTINNNSNEDDDDDSMVNITKTAERINKLSIVFCFRSTLFEYLLEHFKRWLSKHDKLDINKENTVDNNQTSNNNNNSLTTTIISSDTTTTTSTTRINDETKIYSTFMVSQLYQLAIVLALLGTALDDDNDENDDHSTKDHEEVNERRYDFVGQLLRFRIADLDLKTNLVQVMEAINFELETAEDNRQQFQAVIEASYFLDDTSSLNSFDESSSNGIDTAINSNPESSFSPISQSPPSQQQISSSTNHLKHKRELLERIRFFGTKLMAPINNKWIYGECKVCLESQWLLVRSCCSFSSCIECLERYYASRVSMGQLSIECIGPECHQFVYRSEVNARLTIEQKALYNRLLLMQSSESDRSKPCPRCNKILTLDPKLEHKMRRTNKKLLTKTWLLLGFSQSSINQSKIFKVKCESCFYDWCFKCHSPWHEGLSCKDYAKGDMLLKSWARISDYNGQINAQKCPKCKIYIQRINGCDHIHCIRCNTDFCYRCGDQLRHLRFFGDHYSRLSVLGCKYRYKPENPVQRRLIRGALLGTKLMALPVLTTACVCTGAIVLALGVVVMPVVGSVFAYNRLRNRHNQPLSQLYNYQRRDHLTNRTAGVASIYDLESVNEEVLSRVIALSREQDDLDLNSGLNRSFIESFPIPRFSANEQSSRNRLDLQKVLRDGYFVTDLEDSDDEYEKEERFLAKLAKFLKNDSQEISTLSKSSSVQFTLNDQQSLADHHSLMMNTKINMTDTEPRTKSASQTTHTIPVSGKQEI